MLLSLRTCSVHRRYKLQNLSNMKVESYDFGSCFRFFINFTLDFDLLCDFYSSFFIYSALCSNQVSSRVSIGKTLLLTYSFPV